MSADDPSGGPKAPGPLARLDLSRIRHDLRTPINHILGYCEMLQEEEGMPAEFQPDLRKIHGGGRQLLSLIQEYFEEATFEEKRRDLQRLCHELRTPVNHIVGYSELLEEQAEERGLTAMLPDLRKIAEAGNAWLALMEEYLVRPAPGAVEFVGHAGSSGASLGHLGQAKPDAEQADAGAGLAPAGAAVARRVAGGRLLIVDDDASNRDMLGRRLQRQGYQTTPVPDGAEALRLLRTEKVDLVLLDMIMPGLDGYQVLTQIKSDPALADIPVIVMSSLDQENSVARCIEAGAEDYIAKPFNSVFLRARIGACLDRKRLRDRERAAFDALRKSQQELAGNLAEAAAYVRSLLPAPLEGGAIGARWCFQPGAQLGGDAFGYHWLDDDHFTVYLLDVCGHGVGAALLSVSVLNTLRAQTLPGVDFWRPADVLAGLNRTFQMEKQNQLYFTIWYGVYHRQKRQLVYSGAGHPPALLVFAASGTASEPVRVELRRPGPAIGCLDEAVYMEGTQPVPRGARLVVLSDGVFEIPRADGSTGNWTEFAGSFSSSVAAGRSPEERLTHAQANCGPGGLEDDFSLVEITFR